MNSILYQKYHRAKDNIIWFKRRFFPTYCEVDGKMINGVMVCKNCGYQIHVGRCVK